MKSNGCINRTDSLKQMTAADLFALYPKRNTMKNFLLLGILALSFLFGGQVTAQTLDAAYDPNVVGTVVYQTAVQPDGKVIIGGAFSTVGGTTRANLARLNADGTLDASFTGNTDNTVFTIVQLPSGKFYVGGFFNAAAGQTRRGIARFNANGTLDTTFDLPLTNTFPLVAVSTAALQPDGKIVIAGLFITVAGQPRNRLARLNSDGSLDESFNPNPNGSVSNIAIQPDGRILVAGSFTTVGGLQYDGIARLNADGTIDKSFSDPFVGQSINTILLQPDGKILVGGSFSQVSQQPRTRFARLNADGTLDQNFNPVFAQTSPLSVLGLSFALQADGKILAAGNFTSVNGTARTNLARLNADGSLDANFANFTFSNFSSVNGVTLLPNGDILAAGSFTNVNGQTRNSLARLINTAPAQSNISATPTSLLWTRGGTAPDFGRVTFERSSDGGVTYTFLGNASRVGATSNWILRGLTLPAGQNFIRARGFYQTAYFNAAGSIAESIISPTLNVRTPFDFDGDGKADVSVFRPSERVWYLLRSTGGFAAAQFGLNTDKLAPADYDGDGKTDIAVFRGGEWYILQSSNSTVRFAPLGAAGDQPFPADYDADGRADLAVFQTNGNWLIKSLVSNFSRSFPFGFPTDKPVPADYDGDGRTDVAVFRDGIWYLLRSQQGYGFVRFGAAGDKLVPADYDGDRRADISVFRDGTWYISQTTNNQTSYRQFGSATDTPVPADYDGDGKTDVAVFRGGTWYLQNSTAGFSAVNFGFADDRPVPAVYLP